MIYRIMAHAWDLLELSGHYLRDWSEHVNVIGVISEKNKRATSKGQNRFGTLSRFFTLFHTFHTFSSRTSLKIKAFYKSIKEKKTKPFCTLVVARLSSSND